MIVTQAAISSVAPFYYKFTPDEIVGYYNEVASATKLGMLIYNGYDEMFLSGLAAGADGGIGSTYNFMADKFVKIRSLFLEGKLAEACYKHGLKLGLYYSQDLDWSEPNGGGYKSGKTWCDGKSYWTNNWDFPDDEQNNYSECFEGKIKFRMTIRVRCCSRLMRP